VPDEFLPAPRQPSFEAGGHSGRSLAQRFKAQGLRAKPLQVLTRHPAHVLRKFRVEALRAVYSPTTLAAMRCVPAGAQDAGTRPYKYLPSAAVFDGLPAAARRSCGS
jgi:hypothetical protein